MQSVHLLNDRRPRPSSRASAIPHDVPAANTDAVSTVDTIATHVADNQRTVHTIAAILAIATANTLLASRASATIDATSTVNTIEKSTAVDAVPASAFGSAPIDAISASGAVYAMPSTAARRVSAACSAVTAIITQRANRATEVQPMPMQPNAADAIAADHSVRTSPAISTSRSHGTFVALGGNSRRCSPHAHAVYLHEDQQLMSRCGFLHDEQSKQKHWTSAVD